MSCVIGENGSGKSTILKDSLDEIKKNKNTCLYIASEFKQETLLKNICLYINKIIKDEKKENILKTYSNKLKKENDEWFHKYFSLDFVSFDKNKNELIFKYDAVKKAKIPSGIFLYSVLKVVSFFLGVKRNNKGDKKFLIIDEIEKYVHHSLMNKVSLQIISLLKSNINVILSTHSHYQLEKFDIYIQNFQIKIATINSI